MSSLMVGGNALMIFMAALAILSIVAQVTRRQTMVSTETSPGSGGYQVKMS